MSGKRTREQGNACCHAANKRRVAEIHQQLAELHRELADVLREGEERVGAEPPESSPSVPERRRRPTGPLVLAPVIPPDDVTRARARAQLQRLGFRRS